MSIMKRHLIIVKLRGSENYQKWERAAALALIKVSLWEYINGEQKEFSVIKTTREDTSKQQDRIDKRIEKRQKYFQQQKKIVDLIKSFCTNIVQQEFISKKNLESWNLKNLWDFLKKRYTLNNWVIKWVSFNKFEELSFQICKNVQKFESKLQEIKTELKNLEVIIEDAITLKALNFLEIFFSQYLVMINDNARQESELSNLDIFLKNLENEEARMLNEEKVTANFAKKKSDKEKSEKKKSDKSNCKICERKHADSCGYETPPVITSVKRDTYLLYATKRKIKIRMKKKFK